MRVFKAEDLRRFVDRCSGVVRAADDRTNGCTVVPDFDFTEC
jgi:hypothetical protein